MEWVTEGLTSYKATHEEIKILKDNGFNYYQIYL